MSPWFATSYSSTPTCASRDGERDVPLARREPAEVRDHDLDHEEAAGLEVPRGVLEAHDLGLLRRQVHDRVEDEVGEPERRLDLRRCEVADRRLDLLRARLAAEHRNHRLREIDAVHAHPALRERNRDPPRADPELDAAPSPASSARKSTVAPTTSALNIGPSSS